MKDMQKIATKVFIYASVLFGITGIIMVLTTPRGEVADESIMKLLGILVFVILSSFGVSVGLKYLVNDTNT